MRPIKFLLLVLILVGALSACGTSHNPLLHIQRGMTQQEVCDMLGKPDYRHFDHQVEELGFVKWINPSWRRIIVGFENGRVSSLRSEEVPAPGTATEPVRVVERAPMAYERGYGRATRHDDRWFRDFLARYRSLSFESERHALLRQAVQVRPISVEQCLQLLRLEPFEDDRLEIVAIVAPAIYDRENNYRIVALFDFATSKEKAHRLLDRETMYGHYPRLIEPDAKWFDEFLAHYRKQPFDKDKEALLRQVVSTRAFSVDQCLRLLQTESFDSGKLQLLSILAPVIYDRENEYRILDLFSFSSGKDKARRILEDAR